MTDVAVWIRDEERLESYFGCPLSQVHKIIKLIALEDPEDPPEWLRGKSKFQDLPRLSPNTDLPHRAPVGLIPPHDIAQRVKWIVENCYDRWNLNEKGFFFENDHEAFHFRLRFDCI